VGQALVPERRQTVGRLSLHHHHRARATRETRRYTWKRRQPEVTYPEERVAFVRAGSVPKAVGLLLLLLAAAAAAAAHGVHVVGLPHARVRVIVELRRRVLVVEVQAVSSLWDGKATRT
jgi:hypothetical protein